MFRPERGPVWLAATTLMLAGCPHPTAPKATERAATIPVVAGSNGLPGDHASTRRYRIAISYPTLDSGAGTLARTLREHAAAAKREFMQGLPDPEKLPEFADRQLQLLIDYKVVSMTPDFISVRGRGMMDTGGAHPIPLDATFVFDRARQRVLALSELFVDPEKAFTELADFARAALGQRLLSQAPGKDQASPEVRKEWLANMRSMIDAGTQPDARDLAEFLTGPDGLILVFPPYQVAPYVFGAQTVKVPLDVFSGALKPRYRGAFDPSR